MSDPKIARAEMVRPVTVLGLSRNVYESDLDSLQVARQQEFEGRSEKDQIFSTHRRNAAGYIPHKCATWRRIRSHLLPLAAPPALGARFFQAPLPPHTEHHRRIRAGLSCHSSERFSAVYACVHEDVCVRTTHCIPTLSCCDSFSPQEDVCKHRTSAYACSNVVKYTQGRCRLAFNTDIKHLTVHGNSHSEEDSQTRAMKQETPECDLKRKARMHDI